MNAGRGVLDRDLGCSCRRGKCVFLPRKTMSEENWGLWGQCGSAHTTCWSHWPLRAASCTQIALTVRNWWAQLLSLLFFVLGPTTLGLFLFRNMFPTDHVFLDDTYRAVTLEKTVSCCFPCVPWCALFLTKMSFLSSDGAERCQDWKGFLKSDSSFPRVLQLQSYSLV